MLALGTTVWAAPPENWRPLDQIVDDLDPLSHSLRSMGAGLRSDGEHTSLFEVSYQTYEGGPTEQMRYRLGPGYRARVDRVDYMVRQDTRKREWVWGETPRVDGEFLDFPGENTYYELSLEPMIPVTLPARTSPYLIDARHYGDPIAPVNRVDGQFTDMRIDGRIDGRVD